MIVVDASAVIEILLGTSAARRVAERLFAEGETLHAPHLLDVEVAQVLRRYALAGAFGSKRGGEGLEDLADLPIARYPIRRSCSVSGNCDGTSPPATLRISHWLKRLLRRW